MSSDPVNWGLTTTTGIRHHKNNSSLLCHSFFWLSTSSHLLSCFSPFFCVYRLCIFTEITFSPRVACKKGKKGKRSIAVRKKPHRYGNSRAIWDHTVLPATRQRWYSRLHPSRSWYWIKRPRRDAWLSWPSWLVTARDGIPARRRSPIPVVTGSDVR